MSGMAQLERLVGSAAGPAKARDILSVLEIAPALDGGTGSADGAPRAVIAMALNVVLFQDLLARTPTAAAYVADLRASDRRATFDHGAMRTIRFGEGPTGALPPGEDAVLRILRPLGYVRAGVYPLDRLRMTGRAYAQQDLPEAIPQVFLSELHVERFDDGFQAAAHAVFDSSADALDAASLDALGELERRGSLPEPEAARLLPVLAAAFSRRHDVPRLSDYDALLARSAEAAWIATEGNAFNHATDRVADLEAVAAAQRALGRAMKAQVEVSTSGRVRQTALRADPVARPFRDDAGHEVVRTVPGSFYEFISRDAEPGGGLDLRFDSANAQGIFKMTQAQPA